MTNMKNNPKHYREISVPFETIAEGNASLVAFFRDVEEARNKHRIPDVTVLCEISHILDGEEVRGSASASFGDSARVLSMLAREYGREQQKHEDRLALLITHAKKETRR